MSGTLRVSGRGAVRMAHAADFRTARAPRKPSEALTNPTECNRGNVGICPAYTTEKRFRTLKRARWSGRTRSCRSCADWSGGSLATHATEGRVDSIHLLMIDLRPRRSTWGHKLGFAAVLVVCTIAGTHAFSAPALRSGLAPCWAVKGPWKNVCMVASAERGNEEKERKLLGSR